ncbi:hypothetical protein E4P41_14140 [Geodermatophilus sp. DF01-2]|uniref:hypothetical protein n=1 Tax=Geodermatophilus sp. DF01-2 TaxID=2559610 RepID=UPI001073D95C|nr:hypothetical protein [Geodermatophilus sp. DF01_2]TFV57723.1 hypothetical protein E4P41_14140 [Geodermatophilus sp. DF01_2]
MRKLSWIIGTIALLASGSYLLVYVYRWEWHRALLVGILFNACLVGLCAALVLRRLTRVERQLSTAGAPHPADPLARLRAAPVEPPPFRWLRPEALDRTHVFIPILLGGGVLVSGAAWLIERVAGSSARAGVEEDLARELRDIAFPGSALVPGNAEVLAGGGDADDPGLRLLLGPAAGGTAR